MLKHLILCFCLFGLFGCSPKAKMAVPVTVAVVCTETVETCSKIIEPVEIWYRPKKGTESDWRCFDQGDKLRIGNYIFMVTADGGDGPNLVLGCTEAHVLDSPTHVAFGVPNFDCPEVHAWVRFE
jgi:hypothetical protein